MTAKQTDAGTAAPDTATATATTAAATDLIILPVSHVDHGLSKEALAWLCAEFSGLGVAGGTTAIGTLELPDGMGDVECALHGPSMGDAPVSDVEVFRAPRGEREYSSRLCERPARRTRLVTIIAGPHGGHPFVLYTAFGGPLAPREPGDPTLPESERAASEKFWSEHALTSPLARRALCGLRSCD